MEDLVHVHLIILLHMTFFQEADSLIAVNKIYKMRFQTMFKVMRGTFTLGELVMIIDIKWIKPIVK